ncbi:MAG: manganese efflux pump MntP family protein [Syntrophaceticus sp.]|nr:manganese efflux pump MntP family protein [Syntrophaceticus sp.]MDD3314291.1 manganese efflux pump MntP family protein [Syntrophaceticus sp.]MDD4359097.1 manganese efflux pump MntP family protein [Syntrophaceticus sp.]MDD4782330.1 manganese efflux pump MntP family protein [Syntrophaceticus sp.]
MDELSTYFFIAVALGTDAFSLALGLGMSGPSRKTVLRTSLTIGLFHILMPLAGLLVGSLLGSAVGKVAVWIGGGILVILGAKMIWEGWPWRRVAYSFQTAKAALAKPKSNVLSTWGGILALSWSVSVDAFGVGISLGTYVGEMSSSGIITLLMILGITAALMAAIGLLLGSWLNNQVGKWAELAGGLVLVGIGIRMFF